MKIYINTNKFQKIAALVSKYSFERYGLKSVELIEFEQISLLHNRVNHSYIRNNQLKKFKDDLQSFTLLRLFGPQLANYSGHVLSIDPDIFAISDPTKEIDKLEKLNKNISCPFNNGKIRTEVIAFNCNKINWSHQKLLENLFNLKLDYNHLLNLSFVNESIGRISENLNKLDAINEDTVLLHTTNRITQPWKIGLKIDFEKYYSRNFLIKENLKKIFFLNYDRHAISNKYLMHENKKVFNTICELFKEAYASGYFTKKMLHESLRNKYISKKFCKICEFI